MCTLSATPSYIGGFYVVLLFIMVFSSVYMIKALLIFLRPIKKEEPKEQTKSSGYFELRDTPPRKKKKSSPKKRERVLGKLYYVDEPPNKEAPR